jgi:integrase
VAHIQRRCAQRSCRRVMAAGTRACPACDGRGSTWVARYRGPDHVERTRWFSRRIDAERYLVEQESRKATGAWTDPDAGRETLASFYARRMADAAAIGEPAPSTLAKYEGVWRLYVGPRLGGYPLAAITREDVRGLVDWVQRRGSAWQAAEALKLLRMLLNRAVDAEAIGRNPAARIQAPKAKRSKVRVLTPQELAKLVEHLPERWRAFVLVGAYSSLRWSELVALRRDDIDLEARTLRVDEKVVEVRGRFAWGAPKTPESARTIDLPEVVIRPLVEHLLRFPPLRGREDSRLEGLIFYGERCGLVRRHVFRPVWDRACKSAGLEGIRPEWLRHTGASLAYAATRDMKAVAERLGHTSTRMMDTVYVEVYANTSAMVAKQIDRFVRESAQNTRP